MFSQTSTSTPKNANFAQTSPDDMLPGQKRRRSPDDGPLPSYEAFVVSLKQSPQTDQDRIEKLLKMNARLNTQLREITTRLADTTAELATMTTQRNDARNDFLELSKELVVLKHHLLTATGDLAKRKERLIGLRQELDCWILAATKNGALARLRKNLLNDIRNKEDGEQECRVSCCGQELSPTERKVKLVCGHYFHATCAASLSIGPGGIECPYRCNVRGLMLQISSLLPKAQFVGSLTDDQIYACEVLATQVLQKIDDVYKFYEPSQYDEDDGDDDDDEDRDGEMIPPSGVVALSPPVSP